MIGRKCPRCGDNWYSTNEQLLEKCACNEPMSEKDDIPLISEDERIQHGLRYHLKGFR